MINAYGIGPDGGDFVRADLGRPAALAAACGHRDGSATYRLDDAVLTRLADTFDPAVRWLLGAPAVAVFVADLTEAPAADAAAPGAAPAAPGAAPAAPGAAPAAPGAAPAAPGADADVARLVAHLLAGRVEEPGGTTVLWRPTGPEELRLVEESGWKAWPPRLPDQPIFYPVLNEAYARQIALEWNIPASGAGHVTRFRVRTAFARRYPTRRAGGGHILELWVPAEELDAFNANLVGPIELVETVR